MYLCKKHTDIMMKALESGCNVDLDKLSESLGKKKKNERQVYLSRLLNGCIFTLIGIGLEIAGVAAYCSGLTFNDDPVSVPVIFGAPCLAVGLSFLIVCRVSRKSLKD